MSKDDSPEHREVKQPTEARQGEISKGAPVRQVLVISIALAVVALLIIYFAFAPPSQLPTDPRRHEAGDRPQPRPDHTPPTPAADQLAS